MAKQLGIGAAIIAVMMVITGCDIEISPVNRNYGTNETITDKTAANINAVNQNTNNSTAPTEIININAEPETYLDIKLTSPAASETAGEFKLPFIIKGEAKGTWFFEAEFPIYIVDGKGTKVATAIGRATEDWMTTDYIGFEAAVNEITTVPATETGEIVLNKANPSGLPANAAEFRAPIKFADKYLTVGVFFPSKNDKKNTDCQLVNKLNRIIVSTKATARASLEQLITGPTADEKVKGYFSNINPLTKIQKLYIENGTAYADFSADLEKGIAGSCNVTAIRSQIESTLLQFNTVKKVVISIDGRIDDILQP